MVFMPHLTQFVPQKGNELSEPSIDFQKICLFSGCKHNLFKKIDEMENLQGCTCKHVLKNDQATCKDWSSLVQLAPNWEVFPPLQKIPCSFTWKIWTKETFVLPGKWTDSGELTWLHGFQLEQKFTFWRCRAPIAKMWMFHRHVSFWGVSRSSPWSLFILKLVVFFRKFPLPPWGVEIREPTVCKWHAITTCLKSKR